MSSEKFYGTMFQICSHQYVDLSIYQRRSGTLGYQTGELG